MAIRFEIHVKQVGALAIFLIFTSAYVFAMASIWDYTVYGWSYQSRLMQTAVYTVLYGLGLLVPLGVWEWRAQELRTILTCTSCDRKFQAKIEYCPYCGEQL